MVTPGSQVPKIVGHDEGISQYKHHFDALKQLKHTINHIQYYVQAQNLKIGSSL